MPYEHVDVDESSTLTDCVEQSWSMLSEDTLWWYSNVCGLVYHTSDFWLRAL